MMSVTIDVTDIMFLAFVEQCEHYCELQPIYRGHHGLQFKFDYRSPQESYGSISLAFYPSTAHLHVQGSLYLLWVEEHLPSIYADTETQLITHMSKWARQKGIGRKRELRPLSSTNRPDLAVCTDTSAVCKSAASSISTAVVCTPAVSTISISDVVSDESILTSDAALKESISTSDAVLNESIATSDAALDTISI